MSKKLKKCSCGLYPYYRKTIFNHTNKYEETLRVLCDCGKQTHKVVIDELFTIEEIKDELFTLWDAGTLDIDFTGEGVVGGWKTKDGKKKVKL